MEITKDAGRQEIRALANLLILLDIFGDEVSIEHTPISGEYHFQNAVVEGTVCAIVHGRKGLEGQKTIEFQATCSDGVRRLFLVDYDVNGLVHASCTRLLGKLVEAAMHGGDTVQAIADRCDAVSWADR